MGHRRIIAERWHKRPCTATTTLLSGRACRRAGRLETATPAVVRRYVRYRVPGYAGHTYRRRRRLSPTRLVSRPLPAAAVRHPISARATPGERMPLNTRCICNDNNPTLRRGARYPTCSPCYQHNTELRDRVQPPPSDPTLSDWKAALTFPSPSPPPSPRQLNNDAVEVRVKKPPPGRHHAKERMWWHNLRDASRQLVHFFAHQVVATLAEVDVSPWQPTSRSHAAS